MGQEINSVDSPEETDGQLDIDSDSTPDVIDSETPSRPRDPVVGALTITILLIIVLTLVTVVYGMLTGVLGTGAPRTRSEQRVMTMAARVEAGSTDPADWMAYILALTDDRQYRKAQEWIDKGTETLEDQDISADMLYMQADIYVAQGELDQALATADEALKIIKDAYDADRANYEATGEPMTKAAAFGIHDNYGELLLLKAEVYEAQEEWDLALSAYDEYLAGNETAANVFTLRGTIREKLGDLAGAQDDYRRTLVFIADDADALAGLERIGARE